jgi:predicted nucleotidyltransferase
MTIEEIKNKVSPIFQQFGVEYAELFGSTARGENKENSDIDILVSITKPIGVYKFIGLQQELENIFGRKVDLVSKNAINKHIKPFVEKDLIKIYGER